MNAPYVKWRCSYWRCGIPTNTPLTFDGQYFCTRHCYERALREASKPPLRPIWEQQIEHPKGIYHGIDYEC